jgi:hypothetical protein
MRWDLWRSSRARGPSSPRRQHRGHGRRRRGARRGRDGRGTSRYAHPNLDARLWHPWLRINRVLRVILHERLARCVKSRDALPGSPSRGGVPASELLTSRLVLQGCGCRRGSLDRTRIDFASISRMGDHHDHFVDITTTFARRVDAVRAHACQWGNQANLEGVPSNGRARIAGLRCSGERRLGDSQGDLSVDGPVRLRSSALLSSRSSSSPM